MKFLSLMALLSCGTVVASAPEHKLIPRSIVFGNQARRSGVQLSPDGTRISYVTEHNGVDNIWIRSIQGGDDHVVTYDTHRGVHDYGWTYNNQHLIYIQDCNGDENHHLYIIDLETGTPKDITPYPGIKVGGIHLEHDQPEYIWFRMNKEHPSYQTQYRYDLTTGETICTYKNDEQFLVYMMDNAHVVRLGIVMTEDGGQAVHYRPDEATLWERLISWNLEDSENSGVLGFCENDTALYIKDSTGSDMAAIKKIDLDSGAITTLASDTEYEISPLLSQETREMVGIIRLKDRSKPEFFDEAGRDDHDYLCSIDDGDLSISSWDLDHTKAICTFSHDNDAHTYYLYDRLNRSHTKLFKSTEVYDPYPLTTMDPIKYQSRDGLTIHGYLSCPQHLPREKLPLVLFVHGGPWARDSWGFSPAIQWLCNRGYAVLQVNFRGSTGYGKKFTDAGNKEWGNKMQHDLTDAVQWAVDSGIADPTRVAIMGGSYGGYAALAGATFTPDLYRCAIDIVGPSNLLTLIKSFPAYWKPLYNRTIQRIGDPDTETEFLKSRSPLFSAEKISCPILIGQGANDPRVKQAESEQIVAALKANNIDYEYLLFEDEGHGFQRPENKMTFFTAVEKFLANNLGGDYEA